MFIILRWAFTASLLLFALHAQAYETCTPENSYLEALLPLPPPLLPAPFAIAETCIETAHLTLATSGYYGFCPTPLGKPERDHVRPCVSDRYVKAIHTALADVTDCLNYDPVLAFAAFNLESAMHLNAVGRATDVGIGQLTKSAIDEVNMNALSAAVRAARLSNKQSCARILPNMTTHGGTLEERCGFMNTPENPVRNLVFSILLKKNMRRTVDTLWNRYALTVPPEINVERLKHLLAMLGYNAGPGGVMTTLRAYLAQAPQPLTEHHFNFESNDADSFRTYLLHHFPSADEPTRKRVSKYIGFIINSARRVDTLTGATGQCLHDYFVPTIRTTPLRAAPDYYRAEALVEANMLQLAREYARVGKRTKANCAKAKHDFLFTFTGKDGNLSMLSEEIQEVYNGICR